MPLGNWKRTGSGTWIEPGAGYLISLYVAAGVEPRGTALAKQAAHRPLYRIVRMIAIRLVVPHQHDAFRLQPQRDAIFALLGRLHGA